MAPFYPTSAMVDGRSVDDPAAFHQHAATHPVLQLRTQQYSKLLPQAKMAGPGSFAASPIQHGYQHGGVEQTGSFFPGPQAETNPLYNRPNGNQIIANRAPKPDHLLSGKILSDAVGTEGT